MSPRRRLTEWFARRGGASAAVLAGPAVLWLVAFFAAPIAVMFAYSFMPRGIYGGVQPGFTLEHYARFFDPLYLEVLARTAALALLTTGLCLVIGYPMAWTIARAGRWQHLLLVLVVVPLWTSFLVRTYAVMFLLRDAGPLNALLQGVGLAPGPVSLLYTQGAVLLGLVMGHLPLMVLPLYASLEKLDPSLLEAAEVLGARPWARLVRVIWPLSLPGVAAGCLLVFIPALGAFLTPDLLGGAREAMLGNLVQNQFAAARNWPFGAAISFVVMAVVLAAPSLWRRRRNAADR